MAGEDMVNRRKWVVLSIMISIPLMAGVFFAKISVIMSREDSLLQTISLMRKRMAILENRYLELEENYRKQKRDNSVGHVSNNDITYSPAIEALLKNISGTVPDRAIRLNESTEMTFTIPIREITMDNVTDDVLPAFLLRGTRKRTFVQYVIGIPTVTRPRDSYLKTTVQYLLDGLTEEEKEYTMIVIYVGETDLEYVIKTAYSIEKQFYKELDNGLIEIISPRKDYYPDFKTIPLSLGDSPRRTKWRTKQNLDAIFLMSYAQSKCMYYLMIEDDVLAAKGYMTEITKYTQLVSESKPDWFFIQYSTTGGIGKLFHSSNLLRFIAYVQLFYANMPIDWLLESYLADCKCDIYKNSKACANAKNLIRPTYNKDLFKHIGHYSTLKGKIQKVKEYINAKPDDDRDFDFIPHKNPPVKEIIVTLPYESDHTVEYAYEGSQFAWLHKAKADDVIEFWFEKPTEIESYKIFTASVHRVKDRLYEAVLEAKRPYPPHMVFVEIDKPDEFGMLENNMPPNFGPVEAIRIRFLQPSNYWLLITELDGAARFKLTQQIEFHTPNADKKHQVKPTQSKL